MLLTAVTTPQYWNTRQKTHHLAIDVEAFRDTSTFNIYIFVFPLVGWVLDISIFSLYLIIMQTIFIDCKVIFNVYLKIKMLLYFDYYLKKSYEIICKLTSHEMSDNMWFLRI